MSDKEATARIKINKLLDAAGWRFFQDGTASANMQSSLRSGFMTFDTGSHRLRSHRANRCEPCRGFWDIQTCRRRRVMLSLPKRPFARQLRASPII